MREGERGVGQNGLVPVRVCCWGGLKPARVWKESLAWTRGRPLLSIKPSQLFTDGVSGSEICRYETTIDCKRAEERDFYFGGASDPNVSMETQRELCL